MNQMLIYNIVKFQNCGIIRWSPTNYHRRLLLRRFKVTDAKPIFDHLSPDIRPREMS
jgi:hypothetical protein